MVRKIGIAALALMLAACGGESGGASSEAATEAPAEATQASEAVTPDAASSAGPEASATPTPATSPATGGLAAYVGKYPFDKVGGGSWNDNPTVLAGIRKTVTDAAVRTAILETPGPASPIALVDGKVTAWACEQHNCGFHQWSVMVDPATGATDVCYYDEEKAGTSARWFLAGGKTETRAGDCSEEEG